MGEPEFKIEDNKFGKGAETEQSKELHDLAAILDTWGGFDKGSYKPGESTLWELFLKNSAPIKRRVIDAITTKTYINNLLYANICLFTKEKENESEEDLYNKVVDHGWGILNFQDNEQKLVGWTKIYKYNEERIIHDKDRCSIFKLCRDFRAITQGKTKCEEEGKNIRICKTKKDFEPENCKHFSDCRVYFEQIVLVIKNDSASINQPLLLEILNSDKSEETKFKNYVKWMFDNTEDSCVYIRKPLVKGVKDFEAGEIYLALKYPKNGTQADLENLINFGTETIRIIRDYIGVPLLVRQMNRENEELERQKAQLAKSEQMLSLLQAPLRRLTEAHRQIQEDTQELRAILYEPSEGIFAVQKEIAELFNDGTAIINPDGTRFNIEHDPNEYCGQEYKAQWILAHALSRFRGVEVRGINSIKALEKETDALMSAASKQNHALHEFAHAVIRLLGVNLSDEAFADGKSAIEHLNTLKERFFYPFKPDRATDALLWPVLFSLLPPSVKITSILVNNKSKNEAANDPKLIAIVSGANPFAIQGHLLAFISGVISQHTKNNRQCSIEVGIELTGVEKNPIDDSMSLNSAKTVEVRFSASTPWIKNESNKKNAVCSLIGLLHDEIKNKQNNVLKVGEYGDFHRPFVTLIRRYPFIDLETNNAVKTNTNGLILTLGEKLQINFDEKVFSIKSF